MVLRCPAVPPSPAIVDRGDSCAQFDSVSMRQMVQDYFQPAAQIGDIAAALTDSATVTLVHEPLGRIVGCSCVLM
jgi:hypothetical protein